ncbi:MAG: DNA replication/repair protein RecF [Bacilli bacterium]|nr:DNA replication/repair protein RecF [Bacilli bacterium]
MFLEKIKINFFRNYEKIDITLNDGINVFVGNNAQGKTNLLEAIYFLATSKSHRNSSDLSLINENFSNMSVMGNIVENKIKTKMEIKYKENKKSLKIDNKEVNNIAEYISFFNVVLFVPDDLCLIKDGPDIRRRYINLQLSQIYSEYLKVLNDYNKLLRVRNDYIYKKKKHEEYNAEYLKILEQYYINKAIIIYKLRKKYVTKVNEYIDDIFYDITGLRGLKISYLPNIEIVNYESEEVKSILLEKFLNFEDEEISYGKSLFGPHRDDFEFLLNNRSLKLFGSQGQIRSAILALKLSEIEILRKVKNHNPILLLDDVFSELDRKKKNNLLKYINKNMQVIITTTDLALINKKLINGAKIFNIRNGCIESIKGEVCGKE